MKEKIDALLQNAVKEVYGIEFPDAFVNHRKNSKGGWISPLPFKLSRVVRESPVKTSKKLAPYIKGDFIRLVVCDQGYLVIYESEA